MYELCWTTWTAWTENCHHRSGTPRYNIDIAALQETWLAGECQLEELGAGYKFFCIRHPEGHPRQAVVGFAIRMTLPSHMVSQPHCISPHIITMHLQFEHGRIMVLISAYAPTLLAADDDKEAFYDCLNSTICSVPFRHRLLLIGDFNARIGRDIVAWPKVTQLAVKNSNGTLLLEMCTKHELVITNTLFQMPNKYKTTWKHPRLKHWHVLDYIITRQRDISEVHVTQAMRGTGCWSDHRLLWTVLTAKRTGLQDHTRPCPRLLLKQSKMKLGEGCSLYDHQIFKQ